MTDRDFMARALFHARRAEGVTTPNPMVGAVVVDREGIVVGQGRHRRAGDRHAEVVALDEAGDRARDATLYVTLEPCCHSGRTGPCTRRVISAGITRVVAAMIDPNPLVGGKGLAQLRDHGIAVEVGLLGEEAAHLNRAFVTVHSRGRPMVIAKAAASLDGRIAAVEGVRTLLTSAAANRRSQQLRAAVDAIGVGSGTILTDDPWLTVRDRLRSRPLTRVVFDRRLRTPPSARVFSTLDAGPVIILARDGGHEAPDAAKDETWLERRRALEAVGATVLAGTGDLGADIRLLLQWDISCLLVEGGATVHAAAWKAGLIDRVHVIVAPAWLGDRGVKLFDGLSIPLGTLMPLRVEPMGVDTWMEADVYGHH
ncbi:MAG: bifunctional diaminohydroxyphosphoribosylaminopyrimidine deaminase/5-amino-6-(5-phosphoribosylamino)uracil reductase RibD [Vicinamibacterales bacterium]